MSATSVIYDRLFTGVDCHISSGQHTHPDTRNNTVDTGGSHSLLRLRLRAPVDCGMGRSAPVLSKQC